MGFSRTFIHGFACLWTTAIAALACSLAYAQNAPFPPSAPNQSPPYTGGLSIAPYPNKLLYAGRFLDSAGLGFRQFTFRTAKARMIKAAPEMHRIYMILGGGALAAYDIDRFYSRLAKTGANTLKPATEIPVFPGTTAGAAGGIENLLGWDAFLYPEYGGDWYTPGQDGQDRIFDFDWDDRGYLYAAYSAYGWGIVLDTGYSNAAAEPFQAFGPRALTSVFQRYEGFNCSQFPVQDLSNCAGPTPIAALGPNMIMTFKSDGRHYVLVSTDRGGAAELWDVTDPQVPSKLRDLPYMVLRYAKLSNQSRIAILDHQGKIRIWEPRALVAGGSPLFTAGFTDSSGVSQLYGNIDTDQQNFYATSVRTLPNQAAAESYAIAVFRPTANGYAEQRIQLAQQYLGGGPQLHFGANYLTLWGTEPTGGNLRLFSVDHGNLTEVDLGFYFCDLLSACHSDRFPKFGYVGLEDVPVHRHAGKDYLLVGAGGLGEVFEIKK